MQNTINVSLKSGKEISLFRYHPWIFSGAIKDIDGVANDGDLVRVTDNKGAFLAMGHYQKGSIAVRIISFKEEEINAAFWLKKIQEAYQYRKIIGVIGNIETNAYRLIHGEGDGIPGLIIDIFDTIAVIQFHSYGTFINRELIAKALIETYDNKLTAVYDKSQTTLAERSGTTIENKFLFGDQTSGMVRENGLNFFIDWWDGQKTGFFVDQRDNRMLIEKYAKNKKVLNMFCYTGGFSVYAMRGGAALVHSVDSSKKAIEITDKNIEINFPASNLHQSFSEDAFHFLEKYTEDYDLIILDPPAFAKHNSALKNALQGYKRLNQKAIEKIKKGGIIFTFSCSQVVSKDDFRKSVFAASASAKRNVRIMHQLTQPADHAISMYHPEGEYLKGLVLYVE